MNVAAVQSFSTEGAEARIGRATRHSAPELAIVVPTFNEAANVALIVAALDRASATLADLQRVTHAIDTLAAARMA